jgi:hypothetical protein
MPTAKSHGRPYIEAERHDELTDGTPARVQDDAGAERKADGTLAKGALAVPRLGGKARKGTTALSHHIEGAGPLGAYAKRARYFRRAAAHELAVTVGGGTCGVVPSALLKLAAQAMALAEAALEAGDVDAHRKLGETARMHLVYAREICAKDAQARPKARTNPLAAFLPTEEDQ